MTRRRANRLNRPGAPQRTAILDDERGRVDSRLPIPLAGLVVSIVALARYRATGDRKAVAVAGIVVSTLGILFTIACLAILIPMAVHLFGMCAELGPGTHQIEGALYTCGSLGSSVVYR